MTEWPQKLAYVLFEICEQLGSVFQISVAVNR